jgi:cytidine deaminase
VTGHEISDELWGSLSEAAWNVRENARIHGSTRVGAAVLGSDGRVFVGCNIEHRFRSHDVHAEVNALTSMAAVGEIAALAVLVAADRERFTPCGSCLDWIFELGGPGCLVAFQPSPDAPIVALRADQLMPHYPR